MTGTKILAAIKRTLARPQHTSLEEAFNRLNRDDRQVVLALGLLAKELGAVEHQFSRILCHLLGFKDFELFGKIAGRMSVSTALDNIEEVARLKWPTDPGETPLGNELHARIKYYRRHIPPLRNSLFHNRINVESDHLVCVAIDRVPGKGGDHWPNELPPKRFDVAEVREATSWLKDFERDLDKVAIATSDGGQPILVEPVSII